LADKTIEQGERAIVIQINGDIEFRKYLLANGISLGTVITKNYSPSYTKLVNFTVGSKMLSLRATDFQNLELIKI
jgi:Fe2+ transport system protein FeoA